MEITEQQEVQKLYLLETQYETTIQMVDNSFKKLVWILPFSSTVNTQYLTLKSKLEQTYNNMSVHLARWWKNHMLHFNKFPVPDQTQPH
jgi:hypothetical protein